MGTATTTPILSRLRAIRERCQQPPAIVRRYANREGMAPAVRLARERRLTPVATTAAVSA